MATINLEKNKLLSIGVTAVATVGAAALLYWCKNGAEDQFERERREDEETR